MNIGLDLDNVLYPWAEVYTRWAEQWFDVRPGTLNDVATHWHWYRDWGWTDQEFMTCYQDGVRAGVIFTEGDARPGALHAARLLWVAGHRLTYVTDRAIPGVTEAEAERLTIRWLERHHFPQATNVIVTADKASVDIDILLDDKPANVEAVAAAGKDGVLLRREHNLRWFTRRPLESAVSNFAEFVNLVEVIGSVRA
jgi:hypothetical protein